MSTMTITTLKQETYDYGTAVKELTAILDKYQDCDDRLSSRLFRWGASVLLAARENIGNDDDKAIFNVACERAQVLGEKILVNPITHMPYEKPEDVVKERSWHWGRDTHATYKRLFHISPLDKEVMTDNPPDHEFGKAMMIWLRKFNPSKNSVVALPTRNSVVLRRVSHGEGNERLDGLLRTGLHKIAQDARVRDNEVQTREEGEDALAHSERAMVEMKFQSALVIADTEERAAKDRAELERKLESIKKAHEETLAGLDEQMSWLEKAYNENVATLDKRMNSMDQANSEVAASLKKEIAEVGRAHENARAALQRQMDAANRAYQSQVAGLEGRVRAADSTISYMAQTHKTVVTKLEGSLSQSNERLGQVSRKLEEQKQESSRHAQEAQNLRTAYSQAREEINRLNEEIYDMDDSSCVIS